MNTVIGGKAYSSAMFKTMGGWTTQFDYNGEKVGGTVELLPNDPRLIWHIEQVGGVKGKTVLELGALEGAHTKMMHDAGALKIVAIEGLSDCWLRCLIVQQAFSLERAQFVFADFNEVVKDCEKFDIVSAAGVLYHQKDPVTLIRNLAKITDTVFVWSQVAGPNTPHGKDTTVHGYKGRQNNYHGTRLTSEGYCGGLHNEAFWFYPDEMRRCFTDNGYTLIEKDSPDNVNGKSLLFVAIK